MPLGGRSATTCKKVLPVTREGLQRLGHLRQRARVPRHERPLAAARDPDDDPRAVAEPRVDEPRAAGLLRVPRLADGAVGRPRLDRLHRRHRHRRRARPQRPAALALLRHQGRPRRHGLRGRRARHPAREHRCVKERLQPGQASSWSTPRRAASSTTRRSRPSWPPSTRTPSGSRDNLVRLEDLPGPPRAGARPRDGRSPASSPSATRTRTCASCSGPMAKNGEEPIGSMGTDTPLAVLSDRPQPLYDYFKQLFAQVTNPPLDPIREELVTSMESTVGPERQPARARAGVVPADRHQGPGARRTRSWPSSATSRTRGSSRPRCRCSTRSPRARPASSGRSTSCRPRASAGDRRRPQHPDPLRPRRHAASARRSRACSRPRPCTTTSCARGKRTRCGLVVETGDAREVHHICLLIGYGAGAVNP